MKVEFIHAASVKETMVFEGLYHPRLQFSKNEKRRLLHAATIKVWLKVDGELAGETYGVNLEDEDDDLPGLAPYRYQKARWVYVESLAVLPRFQGRGLARLLKAYFLARTWALTGRGVIGHATTPATMRINLAFGASVRGEFKDWYGTGQMAWLYEIRAPEVALTD
ncbi:MAG: GNAT family N-acetyltransferase [Patescibacteria group bacterium]|nr:GNAT family N-acetyltransferase [Patescibacteria group bacterium]